MRPFPRRDNGSVLIQDTDLCCGRPAADVRLIMHRGGTVRPQVGYDFNIPNVDPRRRIDFDRPVKSRVIKEIEIRTIADDFAETFHLLLRIVADGQRRFIQHVMDRNGKPVFPRGQKSVDFRLERRKPADMRGRQPAVDVHLRFMRGRTEAENDPL